MKNNASFSQEVQKLNKMFDKITNDCDNISDIYHDDALFQEIQLFKSFFEEIKSKNPKDNKPFSSEISTLGKKIGKNTKIQQIINFLEQSEQKERSKALILKSKKPENHHLDTEVFRCLTNEDDEEEIKAGNQYQIINLEQGNKNSFKSTEFNEEISSLNDKNANLKNEVKKMIDEAVFLFTNEHKVDKPMKILKEFENLKQQFKKNDLSKFFDGIEKENSQTIDDIKYQFELVDHLIADANANDWIHETSKGKLNIYYRIPKQNGEAHACSLKFESELEIPLINLISIIYDSDLMHLWVPFCKIGKTLKKINKACKVFYNEMDLPFISNRELYSYGLGINKLEENGSIYIMSKTIDHDKNFIAQHNLDIPEKNHKCVRMTVEYFAIEITPYSDHHCKVRMITNLDPNLKIIPYSVLNFISRKFAFLIFQKMINKANHDFEKSPWFKSMNSPENKEFFDWCEKEIRKIMDKNGAK